MNQFLTLFVILIMNFNWLFAQEKTTIIYVGDPMCSWCYGFAPEITKVKNHFPDTEFKLVMGGLRPNGTETMTTLDNFLKHHWEDVSKASGQPFKYEILDIKSFVYDTEPACRATKVCREMSPEKELDFFKAIQTSFYADNNNTNELNTYLQLAGKFNLDKTDFEKLYLSENIKTKTKEDFALANKLGVTGFPGVIISHKGELHLVCRGYMKAENLINNINEILKK